MVWNFEGVELTELTEEIRAWDTLELTFRASASTVQNTLRPLLSGTGKVEKVNQTDGGYDVVDISEGIEVSISEQDRTQVRPISTWYLQSLEEDPLGTEGNVYEIELEVVGEQEKAFDGTYGTLSSEQLSQTAGSNDWTFELEVGTVATPRVTSETNRATDNALKNIELAIVAEPTQVRAFEESLSKWNSVTIVDVPDGTNVVDDESPNGRHTISVTPANNAGTTVSSGQYVVTEWETEHLVGSRAYVVTLQMYPA